jgi:hypothetical protein
LGRIFGETGRFNRVNNMRRWSYKKVNDNDGNILREFMDIMTRRLMIFSFKIDKVNFWEKFLLELENGE